MKRGKASTTNKGLNNETPAKKDEHQSSTT
jgi:hypothetical protein